MLRCLIKAVSIASNVHESELSFALLVETLDVFLYFYIHHDDVASQEHVQALISKVKTEFQSKSPEKDNAAVQHLKNIKSFISYQQAWKNHAKSILDKLEQNYYAENPLPAVGDGKDKAKNAEREKIKSEVRTKFLGQAEKEGKEVAAKWKDIKF